VFSCKRQRQWLSGRGVGGAACFSTLQEFLRFTYKPFFLLCFTLHPLTCTFSSTIHVLCLPESVLSTSLQSPTGDNTYPFKTPLDRLRQPLTVKGKGSDRRKSKRTYNDQTRIQNGRGNVVSVHDMKAYDGVEEKLH